MQYFGIPTCPYCKKRVNLIRTWSLKRQGEYKCPRCGGISNIFLSPLIYVFALLAVFAGGAVYFFHKFVLDDVSLSTALQVILPFIVFFLLSLFMVYLVKPVIKKVSRSEMEGKKRGKNNFEERRMPANGDFGQTGRVFYDNDEYLPQTDYRTGPLPLPGDEDMKIHTPAPKMSDYQETSQNTSVVGVYAPQEPAYAQDYDTARVQAPQRRVYSEAVDYVAAPSVAEQRAQDDTVQRRPAQKQARPAARQPARRAPTVEYQQAVPVQEVAVIPEPRQTAHVVSSVEIPAVNDDFFAKYDDPAYIERRMQELKEDQSN